MIYVGSRYETAEVGYGMDASSQTMRPTVTRPAAAPPAPSSVYRWREFDRVDAVAHRLLGTDMDWWRIMDLNSEELNPLYLTAGRRLVVE